MRKSIPMSVLKDAKMKATNEKEPVKAKLPKIEKKAKKGIKPPKKEKAKKGGKSKDDSDTTTITI